MLFFSPIRSRNRASLGNYFAATLPFLMFLMCRHAIAAEAPFNGTAAAIPGTVQAENYDTGGQGVAYNVTAINGKANNYRPDGVDIEVTTDAGGGFNLGWTAAGQWFRYTVDVSSAGTYKVSFRIAAPTAVTNGFHLSNSSGTNLSGNVNLPATGGWQNWATVTATVVLPAGQQVLTLNQDNAGWNINYMSFASGSVTPTPTPTPTPTVSGGGGEPSGFIFSPYKDVTINANRNTGEQQTDVTGTLSPVTSVMPNENEIWAFASGTCGSETWAGMSPATEASNVQSFVNAGKFYTVSTGGAGGSFNCPSGSEFVNFINRYNSSNMLGVDFDIESGQSQAVVDNLINATKAAEAAFPNMRFSFTIATWGGTNNPDLGGEGTLVVNEIKRLGLGGNYTVNLMVMDYGGVSSGVCDVVNGTCDMGQSAITAAEALKSEFGIPYSHMELTPDIGQNDPGEVFTIPDVDIMTSWMKANGLVGAHFWSFDRDVPCGAGTVSATCSGNPAAGRLAYNDRFRNDLGVK